MVRAPLGGGKSAEGGGCEWAGGGPPPFWFLPLPDAAVRRPLDAAPPPLLELAHEPVVNDVPPKKRHVYRKYRMFLFTNNDIKK